MKHPEQRVGVFIDVQNMYYSARALYESKVNFSEILKTAVAGRRLVRATAYTVKASLPEEQSFFDALTKMGIEVRSKDLQTFVNGAQKGDWDVGIAVDILKMAPKLDAVILVSGDGDFQLLLEHAQALGCRAEVVSFGRSTSSKLIEQTDDFTDLDHQDKYLIKQRQVKRPPKQGSAQNSEEVQSDKK
jgi:uncharacterized LabA/DUF88 family protein